MGQEKSGGTANQNSIKWPTLRWGIPLLIVALGAFLRLYRLGEVPPAFNFDEAAHAVDALDILSGHHFMFSPKLQGVESFFMYFTAGAFFLLGPSPLAQRLVSALIGIATVGVTYLMVREIFHEEGERRRTWLAALTALGLATSFWHVNYSRIGLEVSMTPFFAALSFYFLWRGLRTGRALDYVLSGIWMGLNPYTHLPARFMPIPILLFFVIRWLLTLRSGKGQGRSAWGHAWDSFRPLGIVGIAALVTYAPMGVYFISHPDDFLGRSAITSIFNPMMNEGDFWGTLWRSAWGTFGGFGFTSDKNWLANLPGKSILNPVLAVLFWLGVILTIFRIRRLSYLFIFLTWVILLLPAVITPERSPHFSRMMITACVVYVFPAITLVALCGALKYVLHLGKNLWFSFSAPELRYSVGFPEMCPVWQERAARVMRITAYLAMALLFALTGVSTYRDYFDVWAKSDAHYMSFDGYAVELAEHIQADDDPRSVYVIPRDIRAGEFYPHYTLDFLLRDGAPYRYIPMQEGSVPRLLTEASQGKDMIHLVRWKMDKHKEADPKEYVTMLLEKFGERQGMLSFPAYDILTYALPSEDVDFTLRPDHAPLHANFGDKILLEDIAYGHATLPALDEGHEIPSGGLIWLVLNWRKQVPFPTDYRASIVLEDDRGHVIDHKDRDLIHEWHTRTGSWPETDSVSDYYLLQVPDGTPPGTYAMRAIVYDAETLERLPTDGRGTTAVLLDHFEVVPPTGLPAGRGQEPQHLLEADFGNGIGLEGFELDLLQPYPPGAETTLALHWRALDSPATDAQMTIRLQTEEERTELWSLARPLGDAYPTDRWQAGQYWRGLHDLRLPPDVPSGEYDLILTLSDTDRNQPMGEVTLGRMTVAGRARRFDLPEIRQPLAANLGDKIRFLGHDLGTQTLTPDSALSLTLYWQAIDRMDTSYSTFVHLLDADNQVRAQRDFMPGDGEAPTTGWIKGEIITDIVDIFVSDDVPPGTYTLEVGMYDPTTGERLFVLDEHGNPVANHLMLEQIIVR
jgi:hypothetical protein